MKKIVAAALASATMFTMAAPAQAAEYLGIYTSSGGTPVNGRFAITTSDTLNAAGGFDVTSITGVIDHVLVNLIPNPAQPGVSTSPSGFFYFDNNLFPTASLFVTNSGLLVGGGGFEYNLFSDNGGYTLYSNNGNNSTGTFALTAVPEPATWAMMIVGFGLLGAAMRRRQQSVRVRYA